MNIDKPAGDFRRTSGADGDARQKSHMAFKRRFAIKRDRFIRARHNLACNSALPYIIADQITDKHIRIETNHEPEAPAAIALSISSNETGFRPGLWKKPSSVFTE